MKRKSSKKSASKTSTRSAVGKAMRLVKDTLSPEQTATDLLKSQHEEVKALFKQIEKTPRHDTKTRLFEELAGKLVGHDAIEREIFYPACEQAMGMTDLLGEALVEHGVVEFSLFQADQARSSDDFGFKCQVLSEIVEHHVKEEEEDFFPKVEKALGKAKLLELAKRMQARFDQTQLLDFRTPLQSNLKQVLAGALKPAKGKAAKRGKSPSLPPKSVRRRRAA